MGSSMRLLRGKKVRCFLVLLCIQLLLFATGCSHTLEIKNLASYQATCANSFGKRLSVGVVPKAPDLETTKLVKAVGAELSKYGAEVLLPYEYNSKPVDIIASIAVTPHYEGSGWNFLINFPGFLIFTPAWHGYIYDVTFDVNVDLLKASDKTPIGNFKIPFKLDVRHAAMNRTWTEISWFEVGVIALVSGIVFTSYDDGVTQPTVDRSSVTIGDYIAQEIINRVNGSGKFSGVRLGPAPLIDLAAR
ncbi:MAG TPA: hypothetical protein VGK27_10430 [Candidatus Deferrimicrobiaceae bacterium]